MAPKPAKIVYDQRRPVGVSFHLGNGKVIPVVESPGGGIGHMTHMAHFMKRQGATPPAFVPQPPQRGLGAVVESPLSGDPRSRGLGSGFDLPPLPPHLSGPPALAGDEMDEPSAEVISEMARKLPLLAHAAAVAEVQGRSPLSLRSLRDVTNSETGEVRFREGNQLLGVNPKIFQSGHDNYGLSAPVLATGSEGLVGQATLEGPPVVENDRYAKAEGDANFVHVKDHYEAATYTDGTPAESIAQDLGDSPVLKQIVVS